MEKIPAIEKQLRALYNLQLIDSRLDKLRSVRGELPMEVHDLEDEIIGLETRIENSGNQEGELRQSIEVFKNKISDANALILKYESQQMHVKNNREYVAISKEMELQKLEIMAAEKRIKELSAEIDELKIQSEKANEDLKEKKKDLVEKEKELKEIIGETEIEEKEIIKNREIAEKEIEDRLLKAYSKIRETYKNNLAVVSIERDACGGCFSQIPPQRQLDVRLHLKIIVCENCGRILVDHDLAEHIKEESGVIQD
jgi:predicted  nucleic acid-binding Zn-ribbon protein